jgi:hypothetical protein
MFRKLQKNAVPCGLSRLEELAAECYLLEKNETRFYNPSMEQNNDAMPKMSDRLVRPRTHSRPQHRPLPELWWDLV